MQYAIKATLYFQKHLLHRIVKCFSVTVYHVHILTLFPISPWFKLCLKYIFIYVSQLLYKKGKRKTSMIGYLFGSGVALIRLIQWKDSLKFVVKKSNRCTNRNKRGPRVYAKSNSSSLKIIIVLAKNFIAICHYSNALFPDTPGP